jgi:hypothetical protein
VKPLSSNPSTAKTERKRKGGREEEREGEREREREREIPKNLLLISVSKYFSVDNLDSFK